MVSSNNYLARQHGMSQLAMLFDEQQQQQFVLFVLCKTFVCLEPVCTQNFWDSDFFSLILLEAKEMRLCCNNLVYYIWVVSLAT